MRFATRSEKHKIPPRLRDHAKLDQVGEYLIQPELTFAAALLLGDTVRMVVHPPYDRADMIPVEAVP